MSVRVVLTTTGVLNALVITERSDAQAIHVIIRLPISDQTCSMVLNVTDLIQQGTPILFVPGSEIQATTTPATKTAHMFAITTPVNIPNLEVALSGYDPQLTSYLIEGFTFGFKTGYIGSLCRTSVKNLVSATLNSHFTLEKIKKEVESGRVAGPFKKVPFDPFVVSPIGLVPKSDGNFRMIHHLS